MAGIATIRRGTTPTLTVRTPFDLTGWHAFLTVGTSSRHVTLGPDSLEVSSDGGGSVVVGTLGQRQTLALSAGRPAGIQLRAVRGSRAVASSIIEIEVSDVIHGGGGRLSVGFEIGVEMSPEDVCVSIGGVDGAPGDQSVMYGSCAQWDAQPQLVARSGTVYVYADGGGVTADGRQVPAVKVGDGTSYLIDMPFTTSPMAEHIADASAHVSAADRALWNSGARYAVDVDGTFRLG